MPGHVVVVGAGAAGTAAAWLLAKNGVRVTVFAAAPGASALCSGALDHDGELDADMLAFATALGIWRVAPGRPARIVTSSAVLRECRGSDAALLDCASLGGARVAVADVPRLDWSAPLMVRALSATAWAERTRTEFVAQPVALLDDPAERRFAAYDFGRLFDGAQRISRLCETLRSAGAYEAWLLGPWLGLEPASVETIRERLGLPVGETTSLPGGLAGARFELAASRLLQSAGARVVHARVRGCREKPDGIELEALPTRGAAERVVADALVLALGGVAGGGIRLALSYAEDPPARPFELSVGGALPLALDGRLLDAIASQSGLDGTLGLAALERVGLCVDGARVRGTARIFAAGDVVSGRPRTLLEAVRAGARAAREVLGQVVR